MSLNSFSEKLFELEYTHGVIVRRSGKTLLEMYRDFCSPADRHQLFSLSKSFTSTAFGIARGEGLISLDDKLVDIFPEYVSDKVSDRMRKVTMRNLLTMASGHGGCALFGDRYEEFKDGRHFDNDRPWVQNILEDELIFEPGTRFAYNSGATYLVSAALRKVTGVGVLDYLRPRFLRPIGITDDIVWDRDPDGIELGGWGLNLSVREIAAAAEVWMHYGKGPDGRQLIPEDYMRLAASKQISNGNPAEPSDWTQGYGFQFWMCRGGFFRGDGASGQLAVMLPKYNTVVVVTAGLGDMQRELNVIWDELLPALEAGEPAAETSVPAPKFPMGPEGAENSSFSGAAFAVEENPHGIASAALRQTKDGLKLTFTFTDGTADEINAGYTAALRSTLRRVDKAHTFESYGRCAWLSPFVAEMKIAIPCSTSFFTITIDLSVRTIRIQTPIWFAWHWHADTVLKSR